MEENGFMKLAVQLGSQFQRRYTSAGEKSVLQCVGKGQF